MRGPDPEVTTSPQNASRMLVTVPRSARRKHLNARLRARNAFVCATVRWLFSSARDRTTRVVKVPRSRRASEVRRRLQRFGFRKDAGTLDREHPSSRAGPENDDLAVRSLTKTERPRKPKYSARRATPVYRLRQSQFDQQRPKTSLRVRLGFLQLTSLARTCETKQPLTLQLTRS